jgi:hypothetical protein
MRLELIGTSQFHQASIFSISKLGVPVVVRIAEEKV